jgi:hypothetical protein
MNFVKTTNWNSEKERKWEDNIEIDSGKIVDEDGD